MTIEIVITAVVGIVAVALFAKLSSVEQRLNRLARVDVKLDALLEHAGVKVDPLADVPADVRQALEAGHTILAIKRLRLATGVDLKTAKERVDEVRRHIRLSP